MFKIEFRYNQHGEMQWIYRLELFKKIIPLAASCVEKTQINSKIAPSAWDLIYTSRAEGSTEEILAGGLDQDTEAIDNQYLEKLYSGFDRLIAEIVDRLELALEDYGQIGGEERIHFWHRLSDAYLRTPENFTHIIDIGNSPVGLSNEKKVPEIDVVAACTILYKALHLFLARGQRYSDRNARTLFFYVTWQWYNLIKLLPRQMPLQQNESDIVSDSDEIPINLLLLRELAEAHRVLVDLIHDPQFTMAVRFLSYISDRTYVSGPLLKESLRLSLPLIPVDVENEIRQFIPGKPIRAPGWGDNRGLDWANTVLHPVFEKEHAPIRQLIIEWLLPRYDYGNTLQLAHRLKKNSPFDHTNRLFLLAIMLTLIVASMAVPALLGETISGLNPHPILSEPFFRLIQILLIVLFGWLLISPFQGNLLPYLVAPRIVGGILVGYFALVLEESSLKLLNIFAKPDNWITWVSVFFLHAIVLLVSYLYLYYDAIPLVGSRITARIRACRTMLVALFISLSIGVVILAVATGMYMEGYSQLLRPTFIGPAGRVSLPLFLVYVPISLLTGLVTQFIFEEKTVTSSVWSPEES